MALSKQPAATHGKIIYFAMCVLGYATETALTYVLNFQIYWHVSISIACTLPQASVRLSSDSLDSILDVPGNSAVCMGEHHFNWLLTLANILTLLQG